MYFGRLDLILWEHDHLRIIGHIENKDGQMVVEITNSPAPVNEERIFECFGGAGFRILEERVLPDGTREILKFQIFEFSLCAIPSRKETL